VNAKLPLLPVVFAAAAALAIFLAVHAALEVFTRAAGALTGA
jgi:hypothetical protein